MDLTPQEAIAKLESVHRELDTLEARERLEGGLDPGQEEHRSRLERQFRNLEAEVEEHRDRARRRERIGRGEHSRTYGLPGAPENPFLTSTRDMALAEIDGYSSRDEMSSEAADRLDKLVRENDYTGSEARYIAAVSSDHYRAAFGKYLAHPFDAHLRWTPEEAESMRTAAQVSQERAMQEGLTTAGGFGVPTIVDPTLMLNSNGALNPIRELARVETINSNKWQGVAGSVTASFAAELAEVADGTPTLAGPTIDVEKAHAFVPYSVELEGDYQNLTQELGRALADAKDVLESVKFCTGLAASNEPVGLLSTAGALTTAQRTLTAATNAVAIADVYSLKEALPARWLPQGTWTVHPSITDVFRRFVGGGNTTEPFVVENSQILNRPTREWSSMTNSTATGSKVAVFADFKLAFTIVDRVGLSIEIVPHVLGSSNRFPIGARGVYAWWRVGSGVTVPAAARYLEVK